MTWHKHVNALNEELAEFWAAHSEDGAEFLQRKLDTKQFFSPGDLDAAEAIAAIFPDSIKIVEIASGWGQLSMLLARMGHDVLGIEYVASRASPCLLLPQLVSPGPGSCRFMQSCYPNVSRPLPKFDLLLATNALGGPTYMQEDQHLARLMQSRYALLDVHLLLRPRYDAEQEQLIQRLSSQRRGYTARRLTSQSTGGGPNSLCFFEEKTK